MVKKRSNLYSNSQIYIQTIKFEFKWTNQKLTVHYQPPALVVDGSAGGTTRTIRLQCAWYRPVSLSRLPGHAVQLGHRAVAPSGRVLPPVTGTSLNYNHLLELCSNMIAITKLVHFHDCRLRDRGRASLTPSFMGSAVTEVCNLRIFVV
jgi:hypothetical protein